MDGTQRGYFAPRIAQSAPQDAHQTGEIMYFVGWASQAQHQPTCPTYRVDDELAVEPPTLYLAFQSGRVMDKPLS